MGDALACAEKIDTFPKHGKDLDTLVTPDSLLFHGYYNDDYKQISEINFKRNMTKKTLRKHLSFLKGKGNGLALFRRRGVALLLIVFYYCFPLVLSAMTYVLFCFMYQV